MANKRIFQNVVLACFEQAINGGVAYMTRKLGKDQPVYLSDGVSMKRANRRSRTENKINQRKTRFDRKIK